MALSEKTIEGKSTKNFTALERFYAISEQWRSDLVFFAIEMNFFEKVLENNILFSVEDKNLNSLKQFHVTLSAQILKMDGIYSRILTHLEMLAKGCKTNSAELEATITSIHEELEEDIQIFFRNYQLFKEELYKSADKLNGNPAEDFLNS